MGKRYVSPITWFNLCRSSRKVTKWIGKLGSGISKMWIIFAFGDRSRDTAHAQWPFQVMIMWSDWVTHYSGTDNRRKLRISNYVWRIKLFILQTPPRSKGRRSRSQGQMKIVHKTSKIICRKRHRIVEMYPSYKKSMSPSKWRGPIFDRKFLNSRFCACAVKICLKVS